MNTLQNEVNWVKKKQEKIIVKSRGYKNPLLFTIKNDDF